MSKTRPVGATIGVLTCFRPLSEGAHAEAIARGAAHPGWRETRPGLSEGVPHALGDVVWAAWMGALRPNFFPPGLTSAWLRVFNRPTWDAYRLGLAQARYLGCRYLFVIEDDVYIPEHTLRRLFAVLEENPKAGAACGVYWWRRQPGDPDFPQLYRPATEGVLEGHGGPWLRYPQDQIVEVGAGGLGCMLLRMSALTEAEKFGDLFSEEWEDESGAIGHGGDLCIQHRLQQAGYHILADTSLRAWHRDPYMGVWYPHDAAVRAQYGWPAVPLEGFCRDLGTLPPELRTAATEARTEYGVCSLCPPGAPEIHAAQWDQHVREAHPGARTTPVEIPDAEAGPRVERAPSWTDMEVSPTSYASSGLAFVANAQPATVTHGAVCGGGPAAIRAAAEIPALNVGFGGYRFVHPDFADGYQGRPFAWEYQDAYAHEGVTPDLVGDCATIPRPDGCYGFVYANHLIEHLPTDQLVPALREWWRLLRPGGRLYVACPDGNLVWPAFAKAGYDLSVVAYTAAGQHPITFRQILYGRQDWPGDEHRHMYDPRQVRLAFRDAGLPAPVVSIDDWCPLGLRAMAQKPRT